MYEGAESVGQVGVHVDLLLDPGGEVGHVAVNSGSENFTETDTAPRRQPEQSPPTAVLLLTNQRTAAVALNTHTKNIKNTHIRNTVLKNKVFI